MLYQILWQGQTLIQNQQQGEFSAGFFIPLAALFLNNMANRFIRRDFNLLKSVDRIR
jgi:hypothetical protein